MTIDHINLRRMDLNLLLAFDALMYAQNVSDAANRLSVGQPAMSHSLRRLRDLFGDELLVRESGRLQPTDRGLALWKPVREALEGLETGLDMARGFDPTTSERLFRLSLPDYLATSVLSHLTAQTAGAPGLRFRIETFTRDDGRDALTSGQLDAYVGVMPSSERLMEEPLFHDDFVTVFDPDCWPDPPDTLDAFCVASHLLVAQSNSFEGWVDDALAERGLARQVVASVARFGDAIGTVKGTSMLTTVPRRAVGHLGTLYHLHSCAPAVGAQDFAINLYRRRRAIGAPGSEWLAAQLRTCLAAH